MAFSGALYQLYSKRRLEPGDYVAVNGPFDTYGVITSSALEPDGRYLNQIRGCRSREGERVVASF